MTDHTLTHPEAAYALSQLLELIDARMGELDDNTDEPLDQRLVEPLARLTAAKACLWGHAVLFGAQTIGSELPPEGVTRGERPMFAVIACRVVGEVGE